MIHARVAGIPCLLEVTSYYRYRPANLCGHPDRWTPPEPEEIEFRVCDRRGRPAPWLERKLTDVDRQTLTKLIGAQP